MVIQYFISIAIGFFTGCFPLLMFIITYRVGIRNCNKLIKEKNTQEFNLNILKFQKRKYYISILMQIIILFLITFICYKFLSTAFYTYLISALLTIILNLKNTGNTSTNMQEFLRNYMITENQYNNKYNNNLTTNRLDLEISSIVSELSEKSGLSSELCTDIFYILVCFQENNRELAYTKITTLINHLKDENKIGNVSIAFGMLISNIGLTEEEANQYSTQVIDEMVKQHNN